MFLSCNFRMINGKQVKLKLEFASLYGFVKFKSTKHQATQCGSMERSSNYSNRCPHERRIYLTFIFICTAISEREYHSLFLLPPKKNLHFIREIVRYTLAARLISCLRRRLFPDTSGAKKIFNISPQRAKAPLPEVIAFGALPAPVLHPRIAKDKRGKTSITRAAKREGPGKDKLAARPPFISTPLAFSSAGGKFFR